MKNVFLALVSTLAIVSTQGFAASVQRIPNNPLPVMPSDLKNSLKVIQLLTQNSRQLKLVSESGCFIKNLAELDKMFDDAKPASTTSVSLTKTQEKDDEIASVKLSVVESDGETEASVSLSFEVDMSRGRLIANEVSCFSAD